MADLERRIADVNEYIQAIGADLKILRHERQAAKDVVVATVEAAASKSTRAAEKASADAAVAEAKENLKRIEAEVRENKNLMAKLLDKEQQLRLERGLASTAADAISGEQLWTPGETGSRSARRRVEEGTVLIALLIGLQFVKHTYKFTFLNL